MRNCIIKKHKRQVYIVLKRIYTPVSGAIEELKQKAEYDQLTGLMNKASFGEVVGSCLEKKSETVTHVSITEKEA